jgi:hypothetical protein
MSARGDIATNAEPAVSAEHLNRNGASGGEFRKGGPTSRADPLAGTSSGWRFLEVGIVRGSASS